jgi:hypothetical protein
MYVGIRLAPFLLQIPLQEINQPFIPSLKFSQQISALSTVSTELQFNDATKSATAGGARGLDQ